MKIPGNSRKVSGRLLAMALTVSLLPFLLAGCSKERREVRREIDRIRKTAERVAEERAVLYIGEKYGIEAAAEGYWVQAYDDFFAPYVSTGVIVFMDDGDRKFCVGIDTDDETVLFDNYQREEIEAVLQGYLAGLYGLPQPFSSRTVFRLKDAPAYRGTGAMPSEWRDKGYDHTNMADFYFEGQPAEELLAGIEYLEYYDCYLSGVASLGRVAFRAEDWPVCGDGYIEWNMRLYASPEAGFADMSTEYPDIAGFRYFREWRRDSLRHKGTEEQELSGEFFAFRSLQAEGITVTSRLPYEIEDIIEIRGGETKWSVSQGDGSARAYRLVSDVFEVTEGSPDSSYATVMYVPADFAERYGNPLCILCRNKETGKVTVRAYISSRKELEALPEDENRRTYKIYSNGTCGMSAGYEYAVAKKE